MRYGQCGQYHPITIKIQLGEKARGTIYIGLSLNEKHSHLVKHSIEQAIREVAAMSETVQVNSLIAASEEELKVSIPKLTTFYDEVSESTLLIEIPRLRRHLKAAEINLE